MNPPATLGSFLILVNCFLIFLSLVSFLSLLPGENVSVWQKTAIQRLYFSSLHRVRLAILQTEMRCFRPRMNASVAWERHSFPKEQGHIIANLFNLSGILGQALLWCEYDLSSLKLMLKSNPHYEILRGETKFGP